MANGSTKIIYPANLHYQAIAKAMESASEQQLSWLVKEVENLPAEQVSNRLIAIISRFQTEPNLVNKVWPKPADEYSYQLLQQVPMLFEPASAIKLLQQASTNKMLSSQALMLLTKHFADEDASQQFVLKQLQNKDNQWHAAMAARQIKDKAFQQAINQLALDKPSSAVLAVAKYHRETM